MLRFLVYVAGVLLTAGTKLGLSSVLGQRHLERATGKLCESGIAVTTSARVRFHACFHVVAVIFA